MVKLGDVHRILVENGFTIVREQVKEHDHFRFRILSHHERRNLGLDISAPLEKRSSGGRDRPNCSSRRINRRQVNITVMLPNGRPHQAYEPVFFTRLSEIIRFVSNLVNNKGSKSAEAA